MDQKITIEPMFDKCGMEPATAIFKKKGIAIAAIGSGVCVRALCLLAEKMKKKKFLFCQEVTPQEYSLGRHETRILECVQEAMKAPWIKGVIIYASCMDILAFWDEEKILESARNMGISRGIPVEILYRGPLAKRRTSPVKTLEKIWEKWGAEDEKPKTGKTEEKSLQIEAQNDFSEKNFLPTDIENVVEQFQDTEEDVLLLTPGGCKSILTLTGITTHGHMYNTRFQDVSVCNLSAEKLAEVIRQKLPEKRPLILLESVVMNALGIDSESIAQCLEQDREVRCIKTLGYTNHSD